MPNLYEDSIPEMDELPIEPVAHLFLLIKAINQKSGSGICSLSRDYANSDKDTDAFRIVIKNPPYDEPSTLLTLKIRSKERYPVRIIADSKSWNVSNPSELETTLKNILENNLAGKILMFVELARTLR